MSCQLCGFEPKSKTALVDGRCRSRNACLGRLRSGKHLKRPVRLAIGTTQDARVVRSEPNYLIVWPTVPRGWYATPAAVNELAFYRVTEEWTVYQLFGPSEERLSEARKVAVLDRITDMGAEESSKTFGREIGHCGVCGIRLTNDESRARGIGPICAERYGW